MNVCDHWNALENLIINLIDEEAPLKRFELDANCNVPVLPVHIKRSINKRNRLLKSKSYIHTAPLIKSLNKEIKSFIMQTFGYTKSEFRSKAKSPIHFGQCFKELSYA